MRRIFSLQGLIAVAIVVLFFAACYIGFLISPYLLPVWILIKTVAIPLIISMILAYLLHPLVDRVMKLGIKRIWSVLIIYILLVSGLGVLLWRGIPFFTEQFAEMMEHLPEVEAELQSLLQMLNHRIEQLPDGLHFALDDAMINLEQQLRMLMLDIFASIGDYLGSFFILIVVPFLVFYLLTDIDLIQQTLHQLLPRKQRKWMIRALRDIDHSLGQYIRGQITVSVLVGILALLGYYVIGLPYPLFLAMMASMANIIPYFGPFIGALPAMIVAFITDPTLILWVILINTVIQVMEGNVLAPWIVGRRLHIHPIFIILVLLVGAEIGGIVGLLLAVPVFVVCKVTIVHIVLHIRQYQRGRNLNLNEKGGENQ